MITWQLKSFSQLTTMQLYQLLKLRMDVFVIEQECLYQELDDKDHMHAVNHLLGYDGDHLVACARLLPKGISYPSVSIGRVAIAESHRGSGTGHQLIQQALNSCEALWPNEPIEIGAQEYLSTFYQKHGFVPTSTVYIEDGIPHIDMKLER